MLSEGILSYRTIHRAYMSTLSGFNMKVHRDKEKPVFGDHGLVYGDIRIRRVVTMPMARRNDGSTHHSGSNLEGTVAWANGRPPLYVDPRPGTKRRDTRPTSPGCARPQSVGKSMQRDLVKGSATEGHLSTPHHPLQCHKARINKILNTSPSVHT